MSKPVEQKSTTTENKSTQMLGDSAFETGSGGQSKSAPLFELKAGDAVEDKSGNSVETWGGDFIAKKLHAIDNQDEKTNNVREMVGLQMELHFAPGENVDATEIAMVQTAKTVKEGTPSLWSPTNEARGIPINEEGGGTQIDASTEGKNPLYGVVNTPYTDTKLTDSPVSKPGYGEHGYRYVAENGSPMSKNAILIDLPGFKKPTKNVEQTFESTAIAIKGKQEGTYYGSVRWGYETDDTGKFKIHPFTKVSDGTPSRNFLTAGKRWNQSGSDRSASNVPLPLPGQVMKTVEEAALTDAPESGTTIHMLAAGSRVEDLGERSNKMVKVKVMDGGDNHGLTYQIGWVAESLLTLEK